MTGACCCSSVERDTAASGSIIHGLTRLQHVVHLVPVRAPTTAVEGAASSSNTVRGDTPTACSVGSGLTRLIYRRNIRAASCANASRLATIEGLTDAYCFVRRGTRLSDGRDDLADRESSRRTAEIGQAERAARSNTDGPASEWVVISDWFTRFAHPCVCIRSCVSTIATRAVTGACCFGCVQRDTAASGCIEDGLARTSNRGRVRARCGDIARSQRAVQRGLFRRTDRQA